MIIHKDGNREEETCDGKNELHMPLAVLVNESSASASEIFAGAMQDYDKGEIIGTQTFGKGIVQTIKPLTDGSAIKLTTAKYYTSNGQNIHGQGVTPDIAVEQGTDKNEDTQWNTAVEYLMEEMQK